MALYSLNFSDIEAHNYIGQGLNLGSVISLTEYSYIIEGRVCYLTMCDRAYPKKLAFQYLEDLKNEFERVNGNQIETAARPYAFIKFGRTRLLHHPLLLFPFQLVFYLLTSLNLIVSLLMFQRYIHTENKETLPGHKNSEKCRKAE